MDSVKFKVSQKQLEKLKKYLANGKDSKPAHERAARDSNSAQADKR
jgi:hypothetical protein